MALLLTATVLIAENVFLNTWLPILLNLQPERTQFTWTRALTWIPGRVEVWNLEIRAQDATTQWYLAADHASGTIDLPALLEHRFAARALRGEGGRFLLRVRREGPPAAGERLATPDIPGLQNPPDPSPEAAYGPPQRLFRIQLDDVQVEHVRELWIEDYRYVGDARLSGGLDVLHETWLEVKDLRLDVESGAVTLGDSPIASAIRGRVDLALAGRNPADYEGTDLLGALTARADLQAEVQDLRFLGFYLREAPWLSLGGGAGPLVMDVGVDEGRFVDGSHIAVSARALVAKFFSYAVTGDGEVRVNIAPVAGLSTGKLSVEFLDFTISKWGDIAAHASGAGLKVEAETTSLSLDAPFDSLDVSLELPDSQIPDAGVYNTYLPSNLGFSLLAGVGRIHGHMQASTDDNVAHGELHLSATEVRARSGDLLLRGTVALDANLVSGSLDTGVYDVSKSKLVLREVSLVDPSGAIDGMDDSQGWWAEVTVPRGKFMADSASFLDTHLTLVCRDTVPFVTIFAQANPMPGWIRGLFHIRRLSGEAHVILGEDTLLLPRFVLEGGSAELRMQLRRKRQMLTGSLFARYGALSVGLEMAGDKSKLHVFDARAWYEAQPRP